MRFTKGETVAGKLMNKGWKLAKIVNISDEVSKTMKDGYIADYVIIAPQPYAGVEVRDFFFDKFGMGKMCNMIQAATGEEVQPDKDYNEQTLVQNETLVKIMTEVRTNPNSGNPVNNIVEYANASRADISLMTDDDCR